MSENAEPTTGGTSYSKQDIDTAVTVGKVQSSVDSIQKSFDGMQKTLEGIRASMESDQEKFGKLFNQKADTVDVKALIWNLATKDEVLNLTKATTKEFDDIRREFHPLRQIVYGAVGMILIAFIGAIISLVVIK